MFKDKTDIVEKGILGLGAATIIYMIFKSNKAYAAYNLVIKAKTVTPEDENFYNGYTPRFSNTPSISDIWNGKFSIPASRIPAMFMSYNPSKNDMDIKALNFTPRKMSALPNEREYSDIAVLREPNIIPPEFEGLDPDKTIHPNDYRLLQLNGIIPDGFPISRTQYTKSVNGENEFLVGYSLPTRDRVSRGTKGSFSSIKPLWAVSIGKNFNSSSNPPESINNLSEFYEAALRMLAAEFELSNSGVDGCLPGVGKHLCDLERSALVGILMRRRELRDLKRNESGTYEDIAYSPRKQTWNRGNAYVVGYNGYLGKGTVKRGFKKEYRDPANRRKFLKRYIVPRFKNFASHNLWHMPLLGGSGITHFGHPNTLDHVPGFLTKFAPHSSDVKGYASDKAVRIGGCAVSSHGRTFR